MKDSGLYRRLLETKLPLAPRLEEIRAALDESGVLVLRADPGSGKSSLVPLALLAALPEREASPDIIMLEPRRAAVLGIASRLAGLLGESPGGQAGYAVRMERRVSGRTRIEVLTEGLFVRRLQNNPQLPGVRAIIFDEFHERSLYSDLALALTLDLRRMGASPRLLIMSATMDASALALRIGALLDLDVPVIDCPGAAFPVTIRYRPPPRPLGIGCFAADALEEFLEEEQAESPGGGAPEPVAPPSIPSPGESPSRAAPPGSEAAPPPAARSSPPPLLLVPRPGGAYAGGDILVFLPGRREIEEARRALREAGIGPPDGRDMEVLSLYGSLPLNRQREIIIPRPSGPRKRRIILSTNVAETGLTIPGISVVVDSGFARIAGFHIASGMNRLRLEPVSRAGAEQRAGRAGRLGPGLCLRLWEEGDYRPPETEAEIRRGDLSSLVLECLLWGVRDRLALPWLEAPPQAAWEQGRELLLDLGAIDRENRPTDRGREMARLGLDCRLGGLCAGARERGAAALGCAAAAILAGQVPGDGADFRDRLSLLRRNPAEEGGEDGLGAWIRRTRELGLDLLRRLGMKDSALTWTAEDEAGAGELLAGAFPDRIGRRLEAPRESRRGGIEAAYRFSSGRDALLSGPLAASEWIAAAEIDAGERSGFIRLAAPVSAPGALEALKNRITAVYTVRWKEPLKDLIPRGILVKQAGAIPLFREQGPAPREAIVPALRSLVEEQGLDLLPWDGGGRNLLDRIRFFAARSGGGPEAPGSNTADSPGGGNAAGVDGEGPPGPGFWSDTALIAGLELWLGPFIREAAPVIDGHSLENALAARLGYKQLENLARLVPEQFTPPAYRTLRRRPLRIDYGGGEPAVRIRLQDAFGITVSPLVLGVPVVFHLLSPAGRPVQITRDLPGFWKGSYAEVRKEMRGRYPKHDWPEL
ncbi:MAG: DEAD/DEAH box helicase [Treponema sp.]|jgi:ATP-dependent helicase HrpB|nr:DEAD/DEAH box helicase [Treponema sp.]